MQIFQAAADEWNHRQREMNDEFGELDHDDGTLKRPFMLAQYRAILTGQMQTSDGWAWTAQIINTAKPGSAVIHVEQHGHGGSAFFQCTDRITLDEFGAAANGALNITEESRSFDHVAELATLFLLDFQDALNSY